MEKTLRDLCQKHGLTTISVMLQTDVKIKPVYIWLHWEAGGERFVESGGGDTFDSALALAVTGMEQARLTRAE